MRVGAREIGAEHPPYVIAEIGVNHDGRVQRALELTEAAVGAGADAVKLQLFRADLLMSGASTLAKYQEVAGERDPLAMLRRLELSIDECAAVARRAHELGAHALVTIFSVELVDAASSIKWDACKFASPDIINRPLIERVAALGLPMILSTGAATAEEVVRAASWVREMQAKDRCAVLQCVSAYPTPDDGACLGGIGAVADATGFPAGYSDHTAGVDTGALAVAAGACVLEKHLTYDRGAAGPDHAASLEPAQFAEYVRLARRAHAILGPRVKTLTDRERDVRHVSRQSIVAARAIREGDTIMRDALTVKRPGVGLEPWRIEDVVGRRARRDVAADTPLVEADLA